MSEEKHIGEVYDPILGEGNVYSWQTESEWGIRTEFDFEFYVMPEQPPHNWGTNERA